MQHIDSIDFIGREAEIDSFHELAKSRGAKILVVYGRRRVGKTTLIHRAFAERNILKLEGLEKKGSAVQRDNILTQLSIAVNNPSIAKLKLRTWSEVLIEIAKITEKGIWTVYFEEVQWIAAYKEDLIIHLKYVWDNYFSKNPNLILILCGSSPSFLINKVMHSKALYNRSQYEFPISELSLAEAEKLIGKNRSREEVLDAYLAVGGIPDYLKRLTLKSSVYLSLCDQAFKPGGFFVDESERIFISSLAKNQHYLAIVEYLAKTKAATKGEILDALKLKSGGVTSSMFKDLIQCGFLGAYDNLSIGDTGRNSRYYLKDSYLQFYYRFIKPKLSGIRNGDFSHNAAKALDYNSYRQWLGYGFERLCLKLAFPLAQVLGFESVHFSCGPYYVKKTASGTGAQIDLLYKRADRVFTVCEIKYQGEPVGKNVINECEQKIVALLPKNATVQRVLISARGADASVVNSGYFNKIVTIDEIFAVGK
jgi:AAA+ ATPase superfamily predicted ATPase